MSLLTGPILIFGIVLLPLYMVILAWFIGGPSDAKLPAIGVGYMVGFGVLALVGLFLAQVLYSVIL